jgi:serine/threonine-protein kinase
MQGLIGRTLGHYRVIEQLGAGGMGEVYRATDERLGRDVAIKTILESVASDELRMARFEREAKLLASLSHQNIATLHGLEEHEGQRFLVMELAEGETLAERIQRAPIPIEDALDFARQIAEGLEAAHKRGIIHRDLKPANVMVSSNGTIKILDFGLAKAWHPESSDVDLNESPTLTAGMTRTGVLLGTAAYMSPEQARGKQVDKRADIWAFGCVVYEMLTGRKAFEGDDASRVAAAILRDEPDWDALPPATPRHIRRLLRRCLAKKPRSRLHDIADARIEIEGREAEEVSERTGGPRRKTSNLVAAAALVALLGIVVGGLMVWRLARPDPQPPLRVQVDTADRLHGHYGANTMAISPDGMRLAYVVRDGDDINLVHRSLDELVATRVPVPENAHSPFFSPDGRWLGFHTSGRKLKKVSVHGGDPIELCEDCGGRPQWSPDGEWIVTVKPDALYRVPAAGGEPTLIKKNERVTFHEANFLPDQHTLLVGATWENDPREIGLLDLETLELERLGLQGGSPVFARSGHIVFTRDDCLYAVPFDERDRTVTGEPALVLEGVSEGWFTARYGLSENGTLSYIADDGSWEDYDSCSLVWVDRQGQTTVLTEKSGGCEDPRLSPDGTRIVMAGAGDLSIYDLISDTWQELPTPEGWAHLPEWSPDGSRIIFSSNTRSHSEKHSNRVYLPYSIPSDFSGPAELLLDSDTSIQPCTVSPSGELVLSEFRGEERTNLLLLAKGGTEAMDLVRTDAKEQGPMVSPDGRWLVYTSDLSGAEEIYVQPFPGGGARVQVSSGGGTEPHWSPAGDELFYRNGEQMIAVPVRTNPDFALTGEREVLFESDEFWANSFFTAYTVASDGHRFLMVIPHPVKDPEEIERINSHVQLVFNWFTELERLVPTE